MKYDLALLEQLNDEYRDRPIVGRPAQLARPESPRPAQPTPVPAALTADERTQRQEHAVRMLLAPILRDVDLAGKVVLEVGCGAGWLASVLPDHAHATAAIGVDARRRPNWTDQSDPRVSLIETDLATDKVLEPESIDTAVSVARFEHLARPLQTLTALSRLLREGGEAWLRIDTFAGRTASHRYRELFFPWPHLLFEDDVFDQFYQKHYQRAGQRFLWVNRLTTAHYVQAARDLGFVVTVARRKVAPIDVPFYVRFLDKLGRYAALDLETEAITLVLRKGSDGTDAATSLLDIDYAARQRELDQAILQLIGQDAFDSAQSPPAVDRATSPDSADTTSTESSAAVVTAPAPTHGSNINTPAEWDRQYREEWESGQVFSATYARDYGPLHEAILDLVPEGSHVLDVACGAGVLCRKIKRRLPTTSVMGVDFSAYTITRNQRTDQSLGNEYACLDVQRSLPSLARQFDIVIMMEIIEHLDDPRRAVTDAVALLRPGGRLIITCPHNDRIPSQYHVRQWGHDDMFHFLAEYSDTVCFRQFRPPHDPWMLAYLTRPA